MSDIYDLLEPVDTLIYGQDEAYRKKYIHDIPVVGSFQREKFLLALCKNKVVLHIGSNGVFNAELEKVAKKVYAVDNEECDNGAENFEMCNVEESIPDYSDIELVLASDIVEHLSNPGLFLDNLKTGRCPIVITVPNAFNKNSLDWLAKNKENVHEGHVAWYSYTTLKTLVERHGFKIKAFYWYNGQARIAEGIIFVVEKTK